MGLGAHFADPPAPFGYSGTNEIEVWGPARRAFYEYLDIAQTT